MNGSYINQLADPKFADKLVEIRSNPSKYIEYGKKSEAGVYGLRIRFVPTPGGMQYAIKRMSRGQEGSGQYVQLGAEQELLLSLARACEQLERSITERLEFRKRLGQCFRPLPDSEFFMGSD